MVKNPPAMQEIQVQSLGWRRHQRVGSPSMATFTELLRDAHASALPPLEATGWVCFLACREFLFFLELVTVLAEFASVSL